MYSHVLTVMTFPLLTVMTSLLSTVMTVTINSLIYIPWPTLLSTVMPVDDQLLERCSVMQIRELLRHVNKESCDSSFTRRCTLIYGHDRHDQLIPVDK